MNIKLMISALEDQVYTNDEHITVAKIRDALMHKKLKPSVGGFPHINGSDLPVEVTHVFKTRREDNAGIDISTVIQNAKLAVIGNARLEGDADAKAF